METVCATIPETGEPVRLAIAGFRASLPGRKLTPLQLAEELVRHRDKENPLLSFRRTR